MTAPHRPYFVQALDALKAGSRRDAAELLGRELREGDTSLRNLPSVARLASEIGEVELAIEASRRTIVPGHPQTLLAHWAMLATHGRASQALAEIEKQPSAVRNNPYVMHFLGTVASDAGRRSEAEALFRKTLKADPLSARTWLSLALVKSFVPGDPDLAAMEALERRAGLPEEPHASLCYALGKAREDCGDDDEAFRSYEKGAAIRRRARPFDVGAFAKTAERTIEDFTPSSLSKLTPSMAHERPALFVTGLPRSGTTLTEQLLLNHSAVHAGAELNLFAAALTPAGRTLERALAYQQNSQLDDPWGEVGRDYAALVSQHFQTNELVVDKSLGQSLLTPLMLQALPNARIAWLRRNPDDIALSTFTTYFTTGFPWSWSLQDIADTFRAEDRLFAHWLDLFPDRILVVPYEDLAASPASWSERLQEHFGLPVEKDLEQIAGNDREVRTASAAQVRQPITTDRVGRAARFEAQLKPFRDRYYG